MTRPTTTPKVADPVALAKLATLLAPALRRAAEKGKAAPQDASARMVERESRGSGDPIAA